MGDRTRGLYGKFRVERTDGKSAPGEKHDGCDYFVLDLTHDPFAIPALRAYKEACESEYPKLAFDLREKIAVGVLDHGDAASVFTELSRLRSALAAREARIRDAKHVLAAVLLEAGRTIRIAPRTLVCAEEIEVQTWTDAETGEYLYRALLARSDRGGEEKP